MRYFTLVRIAIFGLLLSSCGGGGAEPLRSDPSRADDNPATAPLVGISFNGFNPETTTLRFSEGETISFRIDSITTGVQTASLSQISGTRVDFGAFSEGGRESDGDFDIATFDDSVSFTLFDLEGPRVATFDQFDQPVVVFRAPSVTQGTDLNFRFQSNSATQSRTPTITVTIEDDASVLTLNGQVSKGLVSNTEIRLFSVDSFPLITDGNREIIEPVQIDETGQYTFTVLPSTDVEDLLRFEVEGDGADMICDAPQGCNDVAFGEVFEVEDDLDLRALIEVPPFGSVRIANINIMTTLATRRAGQLNGFERVSPGDLEDAQEDVASVFGIAERDYSTVPFIDVTQPITSNDEDAVRIAMISGGILGATFLHSDPDDDEDYLEELDDFIDEFGDREVFCRDAPDQTTISIEDIMVQALEIALLNGDIFDQRFFQDRLIDIRDGSFTCEFETPPTASQED